MPVIVRPTKTVGTTYVEETASGKLDIIDAEVDDDFAKLYSGINRLDDDNIVPGKRIQYSKLDLAGKIMAGDLAPGAINSAIPPDSIGPAQLVNGVFVDSINNLGLFTTVHALQCPVRGDAFEFISGNDTILLTYDITNPATPGITRGGPIFVIGYVALSSVILGGGTAVMRIMLRLGAPPTPAIVQEYTLQHQYETIGEPSSQIPATLMLPFITGLQSGPIRVQLGFQYSNPAGGNYARGFHVFSALLVCEQA